jgi:hypothetical protein
MKRLVCQITGSTVLAPSIHREAVRLVLQLECLISKADQVLRGTQVTGDLAMIMV